MDKVKVGLKNLTVGQKVSKAESLVTGMTGNPSFPTPLPALADLTTKATSLQSALTASDAIRQASQAQTNLMHQIEDELDNMINQLASYVDNTAAGDKHMILTSGFDVVDTTSTVVPLYAPEDFFATTGDEVGEINTMWLKLMNVGNHAYKVFGRKYASGDDFVLMESTDQSKVDIKGLDSGDKYELYVLAVKDNQPGPQSETIVVKAG
ncbi:hypothetical protein ACFLSV_06345 [Bacteroidota bacterium]